MKSFANRGIAVVLVAGLLVALATACDRGGESVEITHPPDGAVVSVPFEVTLVSSVPLGAPGEGEHHLHLWFSDDESAYLVVESTRTEITNLAPGEHEMFVSLRNPDHTAAGAEASVRVTVRDPLA